jgi:hypothetical protein
MVGTTAYFYTRYGTRRGRVLRELGAGALVVEFQEHSLLFHNGVMITASGNPVMVLHRGDIITQGDFDSVAAGKPRYTPLEETLEEAPLAGTEIVFMFEDDMKKYRVRWENELIALGARFYPESNTISLMN